MYVEMLSYHSLHVLCSCCLRTLKPYVLISWDVIVFECCLSQMFLRTIIYIEFSAISFLRLDWFVKRKEQKNREEHIRRRNKAYVYKYWIAVLCIYGTSVCDQIFRERLPSQVLSGEKFRCIKEYSKTTWSS